MTTTCPRRKLGPPETTCVAEVPAGVGGVVDSHVVPMMVMVRRDSNNPAEGFKECSFSELDRYARFMPTGPARPGVGDQGVLGFWMAPWGLMMGKGTVVKTCPNQDTSTSSPASTTNNPPRLGDRGVSGLAENRSGQLFLAVGRVTDFIDLPQLVLVRPVDAESVARLVPGTRQHLLMARDSPADVTPGTVGVGGCRTPGYQLMVGEGEVAAVYEGVKIAMLDQAVVLPGRDR
ncbi:hypothetical protein BDW62DRAFT_206670 [Aspergillus aurantiobrunneus]